MCSCLSIGWGVAQDVPSQFDLECDLGATARRCQNAGTQARFHWSCQDRVTCAGQYPWGDLDWDSTPPGTVTLAFTGAAKL